MAPQPDFENTLEGARIFAQDEHTQLVALALVPADLPGAKAKPRLALEVSPGLNAKWPRCRVAIARILVPWKKASRQSNGPFCSSGVSRACLTNPHKCPWRPPRQVLSITQIPSPTDGRAPVRISSERAMSVAWIVPHSLTQRRLLLPPLLCVPAYITEALASAKRLYLTHTSPVFERIIGNPALSSAAIES